MEKISLNGKDYIKSTVLAKKLGYTKDYVGQLCRAKKVDAELVGRTWYVEPSSIESHKKSRYRSTAEKSKLAIKSAVAEQSTNIKVINTSSSSKSDSTKAKHFYSRSDEQFSYEEDSSELIPILKQTPEGKQTTKQLRVTPADAQRLKIESEGSKYKITTTELPELKLTGVLKVGDADPDPKDLKVTSKGRSRKIAFNKDKQPKNVKAKPKKAKDRLEVVETEGDKYARVQIKLSTQKRGAGVATSMLKFAIVVVFALGLSLAVLSIEERSYFSVDNVQSSYDINLSSALESLKYVLK